MPCLACPLRFAAYCRSIGVEAYVCMDIRDLNKIAHILWVRKAIANTRALVFQTKWDIDDWYDNAQIKRTKKPTTKPCCV